MLMYDHCIKTLETLMGYSFHDEKLLKEALTHTSAVKEGRTSGPDNQRLEFFGDAVLQLAVSWMLMKRFPDIEEGDLSFMRADMVRKKSLADIAERFGVDEMLIVGQSLEGAPRVARRTISADALEALLGAVFVEGGWDASYKAVNMLFGDLPLPDERLKGTKSNLQEKIQKEFNGEVPRYEVTENADAGGEERFYARVYHREHLLGNGGGRSKKRAEEKAAADALKSLEKLP